MVKIFELGQDFPGVAWPSRKTANAVKSRRLLPVFEKQTREVRVDENKMEKQRTSKIEKETKMKRER